MAQTNLEISPGLIYSLLVTFTWGASNVARYCRWESPIVSNGQTFLPEPSLKLTFDNPERGGVQDALPSLQMVSTKSPFDKLILLYPHAVVNVVIEEVSPGDDSTRAPLFSGQICRMNVNTNGLKNVAKAKIAGVKARMQGALGIQALSTCAWTYGTSPCLADAVGSAIIGTISEVGTDGVPNRLKVTLSSPPDMQNALWNRGYMTVDGCSILIRKSWNDAAWRFDLREVIPPDWLAATVKITQGCDKQIATCRLHGQESQFGGFGYNMPSRNPVFFAG